MLELDPIVIAYTELCARLLWTPIGRPVLDYLHGRGFRDEILHANHVGADPGRHRLQRPRGLPHGHGPGATFPALDPTGHIRYVQTRALDPGERNKYDNPAGHLGPHPRIAWTRTTGQAWAGQLLVCEGIPDALTAAQAGYRAVALLGTNALDRTVAARIATIAERDHLAVTMIVDRDDAGAGAQAGRQLARDLGVVDVALTITEPPERHDLNAWAVADVTWTDRVATVRRRGSAGEPGRGLPGIGL